MARLLGTAEPCSFRPGIGGCCRALLVGETSGSRQVRKLPVNRRFAESRAGTLTIGARPRRQPCSFLPLHRLLWLWWFSGSLYPHRGALSDRKTAQPSFADLLAVFTYGGWRRILRSAFEFRSTDPLRSSAPVLRLDQASTEAERTRFSSHFPDPLYSISPSNSRRFATHA